MEALIDAGVHWTVLVSRFDAKGMIPILDEAGRRFLSDRAELRHAVHEGTPVLSQAGYRLTLADVDAGHLR